MSTVVFIKGSLLGLIPRGKVGAVNELNDERAIMEHSMKTHRDELFVVLSLSALACSVPAATLSVGNVRGYPGQASTVPVNLRGASKQVSKQESQ